MLDENNKLINKELRVESTARCNASCTICPRDKMTRKRGTMELVPFKRIVLQARELGITDVSLFGYGEPLMDPGLWLKVKFCQKFGLKTNLTTNGSLLTRDRAKQLLDYGLGDIRFSIHGTDRKSYEDVHRGLKWTAVNTNLNALRELITTGKYKTRIHISSIPMHDESIELIRSKFESRCDFLEIWKPHNWCGRKEYRRRTRERKPTCGRPLRGPLQVLCDGRIIPCCFTTDAEYVYGDAFKDSLLDILQGEKAQMLRQAHMEGDMRGFMCKKCDQLYEYDWSPLLWTNDPDLQAGKTSTTKFKLEE